MNLLVLSYRNARRHPVRSILTAVGIAVALFAFCFIQTVIGAWYSGVEATAKNRLIVRNAMSLIFYLPYSYGPRIAQVPGVEKSAYGNWFGGVYRDERSTFFQQFAIDPAYLDIYPEYLIRPEDKREFLADRRGALIGRDLADRFNLKVGDSLPLKGTIFPGEWQFTIRGIMEGRDSDVDTRIMYFHWDYLNERNKAEMLRMPDHVGFFVVQLAPGAEPAVVSKAIDQIFANSYAETLTETETAFVQGFISMSSSIITAMNIVSVVVVGVMLLVLTNTMLMAARERYREYAILKSLGFGAKHIAVLLLSESLLITTAGLLLTTVLSTAVFTLPPQKIFGPLHDFFPQFRLSFSTISFAVSAALLLAVAAGLVPAVHIIRLRVTDALRRH